MRLSNEEVLKILPHRKPMLFVDEVVDVSPLKRVVTKLYIDENWDMFKGHFPGEPVFPGVLSVEAMAQAVDIMIMSVDKYKGLKPLFMGLNEVKFLRRVDPGQTVFCLGEMVEVDEERAIMTARCKMIQNKSEEAKGDDIDEIIEGQLGMDIEEPSSTLDEYMMLKVAVEAEIKIAMR